LIEAVGGCNLITFGELFVDDVFFGVALVEIFVFFVGVNEIIAEGIVNCIFLFEVVFLLVDIAGASDLVDGHLTDHGAKIRGAFESLLLIEVVHLFNGAGVERRIEVLLVKGLLFERAATGGEVLRRASANVGNLIVRWVGDSGFMLDGGGRLARMLRNEGGDGCFGVHLSCGVESGQFVGSWASLSDSGGRCICLPVELLVDGCNGLVRVLSLKLRHWLFRAWSNAVDGAVIVRVSFELRFLGYVKDRSTLTKFTGSYWIDAVRGRGIGGLVLNGSSRDWAFVMKRIGRDEIGVRCDSNLMLPLGDLGVARTVWFANHLGNRLLWLEVVAGFGAIAFAVLGALFLTILRPPVA
jgi:hypothetical protein